MERLFGRSKAKKSNPASNPSPVHSHHPTITNEDEGFSVVGNFAPPPAPPASALYPNINSVPSYPVIKPEVPVNGGNTSTSTSGASGSSAYLDGIPFTLSSRCTGGTDLDEVLARVENISERIKSVDWTATEYDFRLEKSVVTQDITNSLRRLHTN